ncbi:MAG: EAL domain-containing protein [Gammaproteobacteria bacterium]|uniref:bifunctional diguanylate cyclase/phosphodiesterase n=1 Tax=Rhodoferax sp. TaxID=50421 RepID=UPI0017EA706F|nr:EAL domain-containing protein [Rhodoferax sp.]MBU3899094.1 EAL domain-containing protein [Gammaproteobacteria bacterium]MBA3057606.1 EAL domain-containing protein [Rhodoferax sp.]MBU3997654.1 EAL domain-containing protein [Gammaproteobacteria bacterium]MBU4018538.1 EAL domain-containing protein [Gammaproteobacteria bacterium]MBU4080550.1 EAL domain-containing protein [Gammaproteobacteria bacterium]
MPFFRQRIGALARLNHHVLIWLLAALVFAAVWWHTFRLIDDDHRKTMAGAESQIVNLARVGQEHAERIFYSVDQILYLVRSEYQHSPGHLDLRAMGVEGVFDKRIIHQVSIFDASGILEMSSLALGGRLNVSDQEYFKALRAVASDVLYIAKPEFDRAHGHWSIQLSRRLVGDDGQFSGVVVVALDPTYFTRFYGELQLGQEGVAALYGLTGTLFARKTAGTETFAGNAAASPIFAGIARGDTSGTLAYRAVTDGIERVYHFKKLPSYPVLVLVGLEHSAVLAEQAQTRAQRLREAAVLSGLLLALAALLSWYGVIRQRHSAAQRHSLAQLTSLTDHVPGLVFQYLLRPDGSSCFPFASKGVRDIYRTKVDDMRKDGAQVFAMIDPQDLPAVQDAIAASAKTLTPWKHDYRVRLEDGSLRWLSSQAAPQQLDDGAVLWHGFVSDVTEQKQAQESLITLSAAVEQSPVSIIISDPQGLIEYVNPMFEQVSGYQRAEVIGQNPRIWSSHEKSVQEYRDMWATLLTGQTWHGEFHNRRKNGTLYWEQAAIAPIFDAQGQPIHYLAIKEDITKRKAAEAEIEHLAFYDLLTGLPNRRLLIDRLQQVLAAGTRSQRNGALLFIDIDNFKLLNETHGHQQGDVMLQQVAQRINHCVREGDTVARLGGDDFVVMLQDLSEQQSVAATQAEAVAQKILEALRQPYPFGHFTHHASASVGVALFNASRDSVDELLKRADLALYQAKDAGRNTLRFFDPEVQAAISARAALEADMRLGLQDKQFLLYYQPQVNQHGDMTGVEALVRWQHPLRGMVSPAQFIPLAEETGLILALGQWVMETACHQLHLWGAQPHTAHLTIAVNVSALQFHQGSFVSDVLATLERTKAPPNRLKLELTESLLVKDVGAIIAKMVALKAHGVGFSLDDFGTGYSSLSYLKRLPLDQIKIDQSFVNDALTNPKDAALVSATVAMGRGLGMMVIAEGVETQAQRDFLAGEGCLNFQGYFFGRPVPVAALASFLEPAEAA